MNEKTFFEDYQELIDSFETLTKSADNPFFKSKYVPLITILRLTKENCKKHNFVFFQVPAHRDGKNLLHTKFIHKPTKEFFEGEIQLVAKDGDPQKLGAGITYMRRYSLSCMLGLEEEDDDGNTASGNTNKKNLPESSMISKKILATRNEKELAAVWHTLSKKEQASTEILDLFKAHKKNNFIPVI